MKTKNPLIIALDVDSAKQALKLIEEIGPAAEFYKVGMELYAAGGMDLVRQVNTLGKKVFLDLKLYDIGETVKRATRVICQSGLVQLLTVHGSAVVMKAAVDGRADTDTRLLAVTVLTSFDQTDLADLGYSVAISELVALRVKKAIESGIDGIVCSALEVARVREIGPAFDAGCSRRALGRRLARRSETSGHSGGSHRRWSGLSGDRAAGNALGESAQSLRRHS